eukprot:m.213101 g.213101  ORF g.213101 m.213101 type:complete len:624 (-) comp23024_c0_seq1:166-2037(-)
MAPAKAVRVVSDGEALEIPIEEKTTGQDLFEEVIQLLGIREHWYFDLSYTHSDGGVRWLKRQKKVLAQDVGRQATPALTFAVKIIPTNVASTVQLLDTQHLMFKHVRQLILDETLVCPSETALILAGLSVQAKFGDFAQDKFEAGCISSNLSEYLPQRVVSQFQMSKDAWESRITELYISHQGLSEDDAKVEYMKTAQTVPLLGCSLFEVQHIDGSLAWLAVDTLGLRLLNHADKKPTKDVFPWPDTKAVTHSGLKFAIVPQDAAKQRPVILRTTTVTFGKNLSSLCASLHAYHKWITGPEPLILQQIRKAAQKEKQRFSALGSRLKLEHDLREQVTKERERAVASLSAYQQKAEQVESELLETRTAADALSGQIQSNNMEVNLFAQRAHEAEQALEFMRRERTTAEAEKMALEARALSAELDLQRARAELARREHQCDELIETLQQAREAEAAAMDRLMRSSLPSSKEGSQIFSPNMLPHMLRDDSRLDPDTSVADHSSARHHNGTNLRSSTTATATATAAAAEPTTNGTSEQSPPQAEMPAGVRDQSLLTALEKENEEFGQRSRVLHLQLRSLRDEMTHSKHPDESSTDPDDVVPSDNNALAPVHQNPLMLRHKVCFVEEI